MAGVLRRAITNFQSLLDRADDPNVRSLLDRARTFDTPDIHSLLSRTLPPPDSEKGASVAYTLIFSPRNKQSLAVIQQFLGCHSQQATLIRLVGFFASLIPPTYEPNSLLHVALDSGAGLILVV